MINMFLSSLTLILSFCFFAISFQINGINRVVVNTPISIFETSIPLTDESMLYFDKQLLEDKLTYYYDVSLEQYTSNYSMSLYFYYLEDQSICLGEKCQGVDVTISAMLPFNYSYTRTMFYEITYLHG